MSTTPDSELKLYNTLTGATERFEPLAGPHVRVYSCGPTVYDHAHLGNFRFFVWTDVLRRSMEWLGYDVHLVMNLTDVDDNTIAGAVAAGQSLRDYTDRYAEAFFAGLESMRITPAAEYPRATEHIEEMVALVQVLLERGHAYEKDGSVYFSIESFPRYGRLARLEPEQLRPTERVDGDKYDKDNARDFVLWKAAKAGEPSWETAIGNGRPGWHLECSAMSMKYLGPTFDLHLGGVDLVFPHHENEIAQSEAATGKQFARGWMHCSHLVVDGVKMSKSLGNFYTLVDLLEAGHDAAAIRYLLASVHYRRPLIFTFDALAQAKAAVTRLREFVARAEREGPALGEGEDRGLSEAVVGAMTGFRAAIADDVNTAGALGHMFSAIRQANAAMDAGVAGREQIAGLVAWLREVDSIWAVLPADGELREVTLDVDGVQLSAIGPAVPEDVEALILERARARARRDFATADRLRDELAARGIELEDTPQGVRWHRTDR